MTDKLPTIAGYLAIGAFLISMLIVSLRSMSPRPEPSFTRTAPACFLLLATLAFLALVKPRLGLAPTGVIVLSALAASRAVVDSRNSMSWMSFVALLPAFFTATTLAWWRRTGSGLDAGIGTFIVLHAILVACVLALTAEPENHPYGSHGWRVVSFVFLGMGALAVFTTGIYSQPWMQWLAWHHWGAYVGPAQLVDAGARLLYDIPAQYGFGPTALLALSCHGDCWLAMYGWVGALGLIYGILLLWTARKICGTRQSPLQSALLGFAVFATVFLWTAYPPSIGSSAATPSVSALRFLPLALLIASLIRKDDRHSAGRPSGYLHLVWLAGVLWSPESAAQVTVVWWPYYVWRCSRTTRDFWLANARLLACLLATVVAFVLLYRVFYGVSPSFAAYAAYVMHPPGPLPINPFGAIWFFGLVGVAGMVAMWRQLRHAPDDYRTHNVVVLALAAYGAASYYLGRSHDNNLLNFSVFFVLLLLAVREVSGSRPLRTLSCAAIAAFIAYPMLFGWNAWAEIARSGHLIEFLPRASVQAFSYASPTGQQANAAGPVSAHASGSDAARGMQTITSEFHESVTVLDAALNVEGSDAGMAWSAFHGPENFVYLPSDVRRQFLSRTADRLRRSGWLLISRDYDAASFLADYDAVYRRDRQLDFNTYYAIRYVPRADAIADVRAAD